MASAIAEGSLVGPLEKARIYNVRPDQLEMALQGGAGASCGPNGCSTGSGGFVQSLLSEIQSVSQDHPVILVIDEFHALIESQAGRAMLDSLKPAIAEGTLKIVGITTREEYRTALGAAAQNASALRRRFPPREIKEKTPDADKLDLMKILYSKIPRYVAAADNLVRVDASAVLRAVELSPHIREQTDESHISASVQILANAVSRVRAQLEGEPPAIRELRSAVANTNRALQSAKNGKTTEDEKARDRLAEEYRSQSEQLTELLRQNEEERPLVFQIVELENQLDQLAVSAEDGAAATIASIVTELEELRGQLEEVLEGRDPLYHPVVNAETIAKSVSEMTGNDIEALQSLDQEKVLRAEEILSDKIKGQPEAIRVLANAAKRFYSGMQDKTRPWLVAHFAGGTGAGKSDLLEIYAKEFFGNNMLTFNGSEMQEGHRTSYIIGAPQGYVGYDKGGSLAEFARAVPYGVVAVNELDKAHPNVRRLLMEAKEDGYITDADGRRVSVAHLCFVDTSNYGENETQHLVDDKGFKDRGAAEQILRQVLVQALTQAVYNRYDEVVLFNPLTRSLMSEIADKFIRDARSDFEASHNIYIDATPEARQWLATNGYDQQMGARPLRRLVAREIRDQLSDRYLLPDSDPKAIRQGLFVMADIAPDGKGLTLRRMAPEEKAKAAAERANRKEEAGSKSKRRRTPPDPAASAKADVERAAAAPSE